MQWRQLANHANQSIDIDEREPNLKHNNYITETAIGQQMHAIENRDIFPIALSFRWRNAANIAKCQCILTIHHRLNCIISSEHFQNNKSNNNNKREREREKECNHMSREMHMKIACKTRFLTQRAPAAKVK